MDFDLAGVNKRLDRLETDVDTVKSELNDQKVEVARLFEQVASHEKRGEERHQQILGALQDMKSDYRAVMRQQVEEAREREAFRNKLVVGILGIISTVAGGVWGLSPKEESPKSPAPVAAPVETP